MPRYYFDLLDGDILAVDEEGVELPNLPAAQAEAARSLADMARDAVHDSMAAVDRRDLAIEVRDADGPVMQVKFTFEVERSRH
ncbi:DUF6894 family protein [Bradyrhizobium cosmicum]|uniref:DUF6894 family protein n=1 Tax=Bradyrhizobium cosmicum TaxID=1404864 RepID=UPI001163B47E|nr:hypothetical protein [Bradyrhizobium cosmicum]QDP25446.1 hypothetical protein FNV92_26200 [Bradyrhizobium cosmicum]